MLVRFVSRIAALVALRALEADVRSGGNARSCFDAFVTTPCAASRSPLRLCETRVRRDNARGSWADILTAARQDDFPAAARPYQREAIAAAVRHHARGDGGERRRTRELPMRPSPRRRSVNPESARGKLNPRARGQTRLVVHVPQLVELQVDLEQL
ncbi:hypothetical protein M885DRAFT_496693 [Pelagophyceae sp. CCMP2097]|nr:hypothetical protein M885DRAFT_496693 [Pelagophyceae sp. CCMP2097]